MFTVFGASCGKNSAVMVPAVVSMTAVYFFAGSILVFFAFMVLATMGLQNAGVMKTSVTVEHFHDLGKFLYGFTIFWAYIAFSQFMLIWYANMPEETEFFMVRNTGTWHYISLSLPVLHFFVPFILLLSRHMKRNRKVLAFGAVWTIFTHLLDIYWLVMPNFGMHGEGPAHEAQFALTWTDFAAVIGMAGAFLAVFGYFITKNKVVAINEPRLMESLAHENY